MNGIHAGRSWRGHRLEDECPCPQESCYLVDLSKADPECEQHSGWKTMRQVHTAEDCKGNPYVAIRVYTQESSGPSDSGRPDVPPRGESGIELVLPTLGNRSNKSNEDGKYE